MTAPRRPGRPGTRRVASARATGRTTSRTARGVGRGTAGRPARPARAAGPAAAARAPRPRAASLPGSPLAGSPLTSRAALLGLVVCTLVFSAVLPLRTFLAQRAEISSLEQEQAATRERVAQLELAKRQLEDPAFVAAEARRRLHMARPGEVSYVLIPPTTPEPPPGEAPAAPAGPDAPWWSQVWAGVQEADRAGAAPGPAPGEQAPAEQPPPPAP